MTRANLLLIRELNVNGDGDFADVMLQVEHPPHTGTGTRPPGGVNQTQAGAG